MDKKLELGRYSDDELMELADGDAHGGSGYVCATISLVSIITCPTDVCTDSCP